MFASIASPEPATSARDALQRLELGARIEAAEALRSVQLPNDELHPPVPLHESLEWRLASLYWEDAGLSPFARNAVPYIVNNSGRLSANAAFLLFENLAEGPPTTGPIEVLELGAGCGLFGKLFLDAFRALCQERSTDYYDRLTYIISDRSPSTLEHWRELGMFEPHCAHVVAARIDAQQPALAHVLGRATRRLESIRAVFCNYILDVLPSTIWRRNGSSIEELLVSTHAAARDAKHNVTTLTTTDQLRRRLARGEFSRELLPLLPTLEIQVSFGAARPIHHWDAEVKALVHALDDRERLAVNFGALDCLMSLTGMLERSGFVLVNDYGTVSKSDKQMHLSPQSFGRTLAVGLSFPLLDRCLSARGVAVSAPPGDEHRGIHTRLLSRSELPRTQSVLATRFSHAFEQALGAPAQSAREHFVAGRHSEALDAYRAALEASPNDWQLLGEIAEFVGLTVRDFQSGTQIARRAIELNSWTSAWLWNVLGDCLFCLERYADAHAAFLEAERIDPTDPRTFLNLSQSCAWLNELETALSMVARGLCHDTGLYRARLLQHQDQLLAAISNRRAAEEARTRRRSERLSAT